jgi:hypothetical protein
MNQKSLKNLKPFKPGSEWRGNANGRPKKRPLTSRYEVRLEESLSDWWLKKLRTAHHIELPKKATWGDAIAAMRAVDALHESYAAKEIREAVEGKSTQRVEISTPEDGELEVNLSVQTEQSREEIITQILRIQERLRARSSAQKGELATTRADRLRTPHRANDEE